MSAPLVAAPRLLSQAAVDTAPHFASAMAQAAASNKPVMTETRFSRADIDAGKPIFHTPLTVRWSSAVASAAASALIVALASSASDNSPSAKSAISEAEFAQRNPETQHVIKALGDRYQEFLGTPQTIQRRRGLEEIVEDRLPAAPGQSNPLVEKLSSIASEKGQREIMIAAGAVLGVGFGNMVDSERSNGSFEAGLLRQITSAMNIVAPGRLFSQMTPMQKNAVLTTAMYTSNNSFLKTAAGQNAEFSQLLNSSEGQRIKSASAEIPDAPKFLAEFVKDGSFSESLFADKMSSLGDTAATAGLGVKARLLATIALKAGTVLKVVDSSIADNDALSFGQRSPVTDYMSGLGVKALEKMAYRQEEIDARQEPINAPSPKPLDLRQQMMQAPQPPM